MIHSISGKLTLKCDNFAVVDVSGLPTGQAGVGLKIFTSGRTLRALPPVGGIVSFFTHLHVREDALDLFGFPSSEELRFFMLLLSVSGVGPKSALSVMDISDLKDLSAAIKEGRPDLLTRASGIGRKTAERIILELRTKVSAEKSEAAVGKMDVDADLVETLTGLGYRRDQAKVALQKVDEKITNLEDRLKAALQILAGK